MLPFMEDKQLLMLQLPCILLRSKIKILSGSIAQYLTSDDTNISQTWNNSETIYKRK